MNKVPGAVGLGLGLALSSGIFNPAEARETSVIQEAPCHAGFIVIGLGGVVEVPECNTVSEPHPMVSPSTEELSPGLQNNSSDYVKAFGFLALGLAGSMGIGYGVKKLVTYEVDVIQADLYPINSEPLPEPQDISDLIAANRHHAILGLESIARTYHIMQKAEPIVVDAEWIVSQASRSNEQ